MSRGAGDEIVIDASARVPSCITRCARWSGTLKLVGEGKWLRTRLSRALDARDRAACGPVAPPEGLTLVKVDY